MWLGLSILKKLKYCSAGVSRISKAINAKPPCVSKACRALVRRGFVSYDTKKRLYAITPLGQEAIQAGKEITSGPQGPVKTRNNKNTFRTFAWRAMRIKNKFSMDDILSVLNDGGQQNARNNLQKFISALVQAGYLLEMKRREPGTSKFSNGYKRWLLVKDTGPAAPSVKRDGLFDHNTSEFTPRGQRDLV